VTRLTEAQRRVLSAFADHRIRIDDLHPEVQRELFDLDLIATMFSASGSFHVLTDAGRAALEE